MMHTSKIFTQFLYRIKPKTRFRAYKLKKSASFWYNNEVDLILLPYDIFCSSYSLTILVYSPQACPVCSARISKDLLDHITLQHSYLFRISFLRC